MAEHPNKTKWKELLPHGLSASMFGMALGFRGKVSDFVDYQRHIVGTDFEFKGNDFTDHGIRTEPKSRALYEMLIGERVHSGGFFLSRGGLLGCSPDGRIFARPVQKRTDISNPHCKSASVDGVPLYPNDKEDECEMKSTFSPILEEAMKPMSPLSGCLSSLLPSNDELRRSEDENISSPRPFSRSFKIPFSSPKSLCSLQAGSEQRKEVRDAISSSHTDALRSVTREKSDTRSTNKIDRSSCSSSVSPVVLPKASQSPPSSSPYSLVNEAESRSESSMANDFVKVVFWSQQQCIRKRKRKYRKLRLLEIKSPVHQLYGGKGEDLQPFGIPLCYMCQMQGQMAIAGAEECDFFVYVESTGHVEAWRVFRSLFFWKWAEPKLLDICHWLRDGPPSWLDRSFSFDPFDFSLIHVQPLLFPFSIRDSVSLADPKRFPFFDRFDCPYISVTPGRITTTNTEVEAIAKMVQTDVVKYLFQKSEEKNRDEMGSGDGRTAFTKPHRFHVADQKHFFHSLKNAIRAEKVYCSPESACELFPSHRSVKHSGNDLIAETDGSFHNRKEGVHNECALTRVNTLESSMSLTVEVAIVDFEDGKIMLSLCRKGEIEEISSFFLHCYHREVLSFLRFSASGKS